MATLIADTFNRADSAVVGGPFTINELSGSIAIVSNKLEMFPAIDYGFGLCADVGKSSGVSVWWTIDSLPPANPDWECWPFAWVGNTSDPMSQNASGIFCLPHATNYGPMRFAVYQVTNGSYVNIGYTDHAVSFPANFRFAVDSGAYPLCYIYVNDELVFSTQAIATGGTIAGVGATRQSGSNPVVFDNVAVTDYGDTSVEWLAAQSGTTTRTVRIGAEYDNRIISINPDVVLDSDQLYYLGDSDSGSSMTSRFLYRHNLSGIPSSATIVSAAFKVSETSAGYGNGANGFYTARLKRVLTSWEPSQTTWNSRGTATAWDGAGCNSNGVDRAASDSATLVVDTTTFPETLEFVGSVLTDDVRKMVSGEYSNYGWLLQSDGELLGDSPYFYNQLAFSEHTNPAYRPYLEITYTVPSSAITAFTYKKKVTLDTTSGGGNIASLLTDFPVPLVINPTSWPTAAEHESFFGSHNTGGKRVQIFAADGTTNLPYEVESYVNTSGSESAIYWVKVPTVTGNSTTDVWVAYGNDPNSVDQDQPTSVWNSEYACTLHMDEPSGNIFDSTINAIEGVNSGSSEVSSPFGVGRAFDGVDDVVTLSTLSSISGQSVITFEGWARPDDPTSTSKQYFAFTNTDNPCSIRMFVGNTGAGNGIQLLYAIGTWPTTYAYVMAETPAFGAGDWHHFVAVLDISNLSNSFIVVDGIEQTVSTTSNLPNGTTYSELGSPLKLGEYYAPGGYVFDGGMDEVRISSIGRSTDWAKATYSSMESTSFPGDGWLSWSAAEKSYIPITLPSFRRRR
jgi:hypothetical protein